VAFYPTRVAVNLIASNEKGITGMFESEQSVAVTRYYNNNDDDEVVQRKDGVRKRRCCDTWISNIILTT
jgi:hypothetical protein